MKIIDLISAIEVFAAPELQEDYDNAGLITGNGDRECSGVLCSLDVTLEVIKEAQASNCNLIISHHPIIFKGLKRINGKSYVESIIIEAIKNDIALYAAHTNLDNVLLGVNGMIAQKLGLKDIEVLQPKKRLLRRLITFAPVDKAEEVRKAVFNAGAGHIGQYSECSFNSEGTGTFKAEEGANPYVGEIGKQHQEKETKIEIVYPFYLETQVVKALVKHHPYEEVAYDIFTMENSHLGMGSGVVGYLEAPMEEKGFLNLLKDRFAANGIRYTSLLGKPIQKVAVCGGAGSFLLKKAISSQADIYITGDVKYHEFFDAEGKIVLADIGHYESEQYTVELLSDLLLKKFPTFAVLKSSVNTNPVNYLG
ncbi:Nif3-like dinuclear metal center hexameric protein [Flavisolibacter ginsengisoli]|jgi:dinuclear metal center YbgI/SA1388 family protein|uniref:GTP cyclohydrolase 1 type 2 homolog n=1 Tax=Flavisolibacter ginsengisoli DSM 18119 TaxID=1121884 RepID=A0A1M5EWL0_9BACT|nr:Nif3-like dinuclear metal center hexameric protein [Flavisolibacter ginsengisoli]SHF83640.1 dinuclear metal center protein, YbgI/SA1388 family [Flavisolibacter ginsengisoli DSM 18119]